MIEGATHTMFIIPPGDGPVELRWTKGQPNLDQLQEACGGKGEQLAPRLVTVELIRPPVRVQGFRRLLAYCDEDGRAKGLRVNFRASRLWQAGGGIGGLVGPVVLVAHGVFGSIGVLGRDWQE